MRVYFGVCGVGLGHVGRCISVAQDLLKRGDEVVFSTYSDALEYVAHEGIPYLEAPAIRYPVKQDGEVDFRQTTVYPGAFSSLIFLNQVSAEIKYIRAFKPHVVVSDSRASTIAAARLLSLPVLTILNLYRVRIPRERRFVRLAQIADGGILTVVGRLWNMGEEILVPDFPEPYTLSEGNLGIPPWRKSRVRLVGPVLPVRRSDLPGQEELRKKLGLLDGPVIFVPISGPSQEKEYFIGKMRDILLKMPREYQVVVSLANPDGNRQPLQLGNVTIYNWIPNRFEFLKACDMVVCRAGLGTISQAICYGKPFLTVPTPSHTEQQNNASRAEALGVAKVLNQRRLSFEYVLSNIKEILSKGYAERAEQLQREVGNYDATKAIVAAIACHEAP
jgi:UDP:flavonoid glycosyltransferase YjiC (YdhE family)